MWSEYVTTEILNRASSTGRLRDFESPLTFIHRVMDAFLVFVGLWVACWFTGVPWSSPMLIAGAAASILFYVLGVSKSLYRSWRTERLTKEAGYVLEAWLGVAGILIVAVYLQQDVVGYPPATVTLWFLGTPLLLVVWRLGVRFLLRWARTKGFNTRRIAIAGSGELARHLARVVVDSPWMGFRIVGLFDDADESAETGRTGTKDRRSLEEMCDVARRGGVDAVYLALPAGQAERRSEDLMRRLGDTTAAVYLVQDRRSRASREDGASSQVLPDLGRVDVLHRTRVDLGGIMAVSIYETPFVGPERWVKRVEDIVVSSLALLLLALPMAVIAMGVKLSGPGPVFFKQRRYGLDGKEIMVWKFRSMSVCEDGDKVIQAQKNDSRVTRFGAFIRKTSLDELPQFINVFLGSMSIVGPRPHAVAHNEHYRSLIGGYMLRHMVKPGITGWAQINGWRGETDSLDKMGKRVDFDLEYIGHWSLWFDIRIIAMTAFRGFIQKNAY